MISKIALMSFCISMFLCFSAWAAGFKGKVIDAYTEEPIEGAVVVAVWWGQRGFFFGSTERLKDVKEALTDREGKWFIAGPEGYERKLSPVSCNSFEFGQLRVLRSLYSNPVIALGQMGFPLMAVRRKLSLKERVKLWKERQLSYQD